MESNEVLDRLPKHLLDLVIEQPYNTYTAQDHAIWRYVMRQNVRYLSRVAHGSYVNGLKSTGISIDYIPHMYGMNRILKEIGWAAVAVDGFIPPAAFMEFQAYKVLVIAADIRPFDQIEYTPAPDIIHEAAGHAPIIADAEYANYLMEFGKIGSKAFSSAKDYEIYEAIRHLSILKADPYTLPEEIERAEAQLSEMEKISGPPSEMSRIRNLHWWTVEYGLIGDLNKPRIYGAGLLSSIGESYSSLQDDVRKLPYTIEAAEVGFDITTRQPQLFVTPNFQHLTDVLHDFASGMAMNNGGVDGMLMAIESNNTATAVYSSGLQVSGTFSEVIIHRDEPIYIKTDSPTTLNFEDNLLPGHDKSHHSDGFGSPVGLLAVSQTPLEKMSSGDLEALNIKINEECKLNFRSGVQVTGRLQSITRQNGSILLMTFTQCTVSFRDRILFRPEWGVYDMAVGERIISAFSGPADADGFGLKFPVPQEKTHKIVHSPEAMELHRLYQLVRDVREKGMDVNVLTQVWAIMKQEYPDEWLLAIEVLELLVQADTAPDLATDIRSSLESLSNTRKDLATLINNGFECLQSKTPPSVSA